jgi:hypothetical protein
MTASQPFVRFAIQFRVARLFSPWMARVTSAETSSREGKRCPRLGSFNYGISRSPVDLCLDCMEREVTLPTRIYLAEYESVCRLLHYEPQGYVNLGEGD